MRASLLRSAAGLALSSILAARLLPRSAPHSTLVDPSARAGELTAFGLRCFAALLAAYLALVFLALVLSSARVLPASARRWLGRRTTGGLAGGLRRLVGLSALTVGVLPLAPVAASAAPPPPVLAPHDATIPSTPPPRLRPAVPDTPSAPVHPPPPRGEASEPGPASMPVGAPPPRPDPGPGVGTITVGAADSFWTIAARLTGTRLGRPATDHEVVEPWLALIEANRDHLVDPTDPDLLFPGQVLRVPR